MTECCFSAVEWAETGLELFIQIVVREVRLELGGNCFFKDLGNEG